MNSPREIAVNYLAIGEGKVRLSLLRTLLLGMMAGMFIALAAVGSNTASSTIASASAAKLMGACVFPTGLAMVLLAGSELFTGNTLLVMPLLSGKITWRQMLRNWVLVYIGNLLGALLIVAVTAYGNQWSLFGGALAVTTIKVAAAKTSFSFLSGVMLGIGCNFLVCIAVWISFAAKTVVGKVAGLYLPIMLFVLSGFEHSVANMYYVPAGVVAAANPHFAALAVESGVDISGLSWGSFFVNNLLPVTVGNIIGGAVLVGCVYWYVYLKPEKKES